MWGFHNARSGLCFPSYEKIAERAGCARSTVAEAIKALEDGGLADMGQSHHAHPRALRRPVRAHREPLARHPHQQRLRSFNDPKGAADRGFLLSPIFRLEPQFKNLFLLLRPLPHPKSTPSTDLGAALLRLQKAMQSRGHTARSGAPAAQHFTMKKIRSR